MTKEEKQLIKLNGLFFFAASLAGIFVNIFLFQLGGFRAVVLFGLINLTFLFIIYSLSGYFLKRYSSNSLIRLGLLFFVFQYGFLLIMGEKSIHYLIVLGAVAGIGNGSFWSGNNLTQYIVTSERSRNEFFGKLNFLINVVSSIGPLLGGFIIYLFNLYSIKTFGYVTVFSIASLLFFIAFLITKKLPSHSGVNYSLWQIIQNKRTIQWRIVLSQQFLYGLFDVSFSTFSSILIFLFLKQEFLVGAISTTSSLVFAIANFAAIKILKINKQSYILGTFLSSLGIFLFGIYQNWLGIFGLIFLCNVFIPLLNITTSKGIYDTIDKIKMGWKDKYYFLVERDLILGISRILVYGVLFFLFTPQNQTAISKNWILVIPIFPLLIGLLQISKERKVKDST